MSDEESAVGESMVNILVTVDEQHLETLSNVARQLEAAGMKVAEVFPNSGIIAGAAAGKAIGRLRSVQGVASVEEEPTFEAQGPSE